MKSEIGAEIKREETMIRKINRLSKSELIRLIKSYDEYIQEANEERRYDEGWPPVCINEFYDCEFQELRNR